ncbi:MAG: hypothetical protein LUH01_03775 [Parabacteroides gordonii]|nr:hypothetical protein [Parabacteroides gordonii]
MKKYNFYYLPILLLACLLACTEEEIGRKAITGDLIRIQAARPQDGPTTTSDDP